MENLETLEKPDELICKDIPEWGHLGGLAFCRRSLSWWEWGYKTENNQPNAIFSTVLLLFFSFKLPNID